MTLSTRRRTPRTRAHNDTEPEEPIDLDAPKTEVDWLIVDTIVDNYQETKDAETNSALVAEDPTFSKSNDKVKERHHCASTPRPPPYLPGTRLDHGISEDPVSTPWSFFLHTPSVQRRGG